MLELPPYVYLGYVLMQVILTLFVIMYVAFWWMGSTDLSMGHRNRKVSAYTYALSELSDSENFTITIIVEIVIFTIINTIMIVHLLNSINCFCFAVKKFLGLLSFSMNIAIKSA